MKKLVRFFIAIAGLGIGVGLVSIIIYNFCFPGYNYVMRYTTDTGALIAIYVGAGFVCGILGYSAGPQIIEKTGHLFHGIEEYFRKMPAMDILFGIAGTMAGMLCALLVSRLFSGMSNRYAYIAIAVILYVLLGIVGWNFGTKRRAEIISGAKNPGGALPKVMDTSALIDGRILDVCEAGFVEGTLVVPGFVLKELRHIADHSEASKRGRGRRGLDVVKAMQEKLGGRVVVDNSDFPDVDEVDAKLLELAQKLGGVLVTDDYNLNKVAEVRHIPVLNINDLANAVKPVVLPGEELSIAILREGKEAGQGVGFLPDGTMVIVEGGKRYIGQQVAVQVSSNLQTSAGRLIFARTHSH